MTKSKKVTPAQVETMNKISNLIQNMNWSERIVLKADSVESNRERYNQVLDGMVWETESDLTPSQAEARARHHKRIMSMKFEIKKKSA